MQRDFYQILGVKRDASDEEIKRAYRKLARQYQMERGLPTKCMVISRTSACTGTNGSGFVHTPATIRRP